MKSGDLACMYIQYYMDKPFFKDEYQRWIPLYLKKMKICVLVKKNTPMMELIIIKYYTQTDGEEETDVKIINYDNHSIVNLKGMKNYILDIIYLLAQTFGLIIQPLSMNKQKITFSKFQKEDLKDIVYNERKVDCIVSNTVNVWLIILSNMKIEPISDELVSICEF